MKCKRCGREFTGNFCPQCGQRAEEGAEPAPAVQPQCGQRAEATEQAPAVQQREVQGVQTAQGAQAAAAEKADWQFSAKPRWEFGQPRKKSENAVALQWGCFLLFLLLAASAFLFFFLNSIGYSLMGIAVETHSVFGLTGMFGAEDGWLTEQSLFEPYNGYILVFSLLYFAVALLGAAEVYACFQSVGNYHRALRKKLFAYACGQAGCSLAAMVLYLLFSNAFFADMGIAVGELSVLPYVCFGVNALLCCIALVLFLTKNKDEHAYLTAWDTLGVAAFCKKHRSAVFVVVGLVCAAATLVLFLCYPLYSDGFFTYTLPQVRDALFIWNGAEGMDAGRTLCVVCFVLLAVCAALYVLHSVLAASVDPEEAAKRGYSTGRQMWGAVAGVVAILALFVVMIILGMFLPDNLLIADDDAGYRVFFELLFLWYAVYEVATFPEKLSAVRFSPEEIKNIRALQKRGGLGR